MTRKFSKKKLLEAIKGTGGIMSTIAARLDCEWHTAYTYTHDGGEIEAAYVDECERVLDLAEGKIIESIKNGDTSDAKWLLTRKGRKRGYGEALDVTSGGESLTNKMTDEERMERMKQLAVAIAKELDDGHKPSE